MEEQIYRKSRRMLSLDLDTRITPPSSPHYLPSEAQMKDDIHFEVESDPPFESQVEGIVETLEESYL